jgi:uncharacterized protein YegL
MTNGNTQQLLLPFYLAVDVSYSMSVTDNRPDASPPIAAANTIVSHVRDSLYVNPLLIDKVRFAMVDFSDDAQTVIPMCDLTKMATDDIPTLVVRGGTSFAAAFLKLRSQIDSDVRQMKADGHKVHRPAVFFLTDGEPTDPDSEWKQAFAELTDPSFSARPNVIPFGVGDAQKQVLDQIAFPQGKMRSFVMREGANAAEAIKQMAELLIGSVIASGNSVTMGGSSGGGGFIPPEDEDGDWL